MSQAPVDLVEADASTSLGPRFWRMWTAGIIDNVGDGALVVGVGLLATTLTQDPRLVALVSACAMLPWLLITLPVGVLVDRVDRVHAMRMAQVGQAMAMALLTVLAWVHAIDVPLLAFITFVVTSGQVVFDMAAQSVVPQLVPKSELVRANSLTYTSQTVSANFVGQPLGGVLFAAASALPFGLETISYLGSAGLLAGIPKEPVGSKPRRSVLEDTREGMSYLFRHQLLRTLALVLGANAFAFQMGVSVMVLFATRTLGVPHAVYGLVLGGSAVGAVLGGIVSPRLVRLVGKRAALVIGMTINAGSLGAVGLAQNGLQVGVIIAVLGFSVTIWNVITVSLRQEIVPTDLLGRVNGAYRLVGWGLVPVGALLSGFVADVWGLRAPFLIAGGLEYAVLAMALPILWPAIKALHPADEDMLDLDVERPVNRRRP